MPIVLRIFLFIVAILSSLAMLYKIRKSKLQIQYAIFWIVISILIILMCIFPQVAFFLSGFVGIESPSNFVFSTIIFALLVKSFYMTIEISSLEDKVKELVQEIALKEHSQEEDNK